MACLSRISGITAIALAIALAGCNRERRDLRAAPSGRVLLGDTARQSSLEPGGKLPHAMVSNPFNGNAYAISEGQRLFNWYNCSGCHANGGGGIGPSLMDKTWIYGGEPANLFDTIVKGRPNGMPGWGGRIPEYQIWQIVAFVRSLSGEQPRAATPARSDTLEQKSNRILQREPQK